MTLTEARRLFTEKLKGLAPNTQKQKWSVWRKMQAFCKSKNINDISELGLNMELYAGGLEEYLSGKSVAQTITVTKIILRELGIQVEYSYRINRDDIQAHKLKQAERMFDEAEISRLKEWVMTFDGPKGQQNAALIFMLIETGARVGELANLKAKDVDLIRNTAWISRSKTQPRPVIFSDKTKDLLTFTNMGDADYVFPGKEAGIRNVVNGILESLDLKKNGDGRGPHTFRHWFATNMLFNGGMKPEHLAYVMGDKVGVVLETYVHPTPKMLKAVYPRGFFEGKV